jgi:hypothetical protein
MKPTLISHTHWQAAQSPNAIQSLPISVSEPTHGQKKKSTTAQHCISVMRVDCLKLKILQVNKFAVGGQESGFKNPHLP